MLFISHRCSEKQKYLIDNEKNFLRLKYYSKVKSNDSNTYVICFEYMNYIIINFGLIYYFGKYQLVLTDNGEK